jgi:peptidoglycan DL-endopeptidase CwlO
LRSRNRAISIALGAAALITLVAPSGGNAASGGNQSQIAALQAQRAALVSQLNALLPGQAGAAGQLKAAESVYGSAQGQVLAAQAALNATNQKLQTLTQEIAADEAIVASAKRELASGARGAYEDDSSNGVVSAVLDSKNFGDAVQQLQGAQNIGVHLQQLQATLTSRSDALIKEKADLSSTSASATAQEQALANQSNQFLAAVANRSSVYNQASAPVRALEAQIANIDNQIAALESPGGTVNGGGPCGNHFAFGQCTWYVATRRCIPWMGNADTWFSAAAADGYAEGHQPEVGAVVVFWPGGDGASRVGHVGYVEAVGPADGVPAGEFKLSEMNFAGWDRVSYRILPNNSSGIQGFIYGHN